MSKKEREKEVTTHTRTSAAQIVASTFGILAGLAGVLHGSFEILQGNATPVGLFFEAIGPAQRFWEYGTLHALTIIPNYLLTGILAVIVGALVAIWAGWFVHTRHGAMVLLLLSITLFLVGGGFNPIYMSVLAVLMAARIDKPLTRLRRWVPGSLLSFLPPMWLGALIAFVLVFVIGVIIAVFGWPLTAFFDADTVATSHLSILAYLLLGLMMLSVLTVLARDVEESTAKGMQTHG